MERRRRLDEKAPKERGDAREEDEAAAAAAAMDFQTLSRRELQALCKSKGIRANMSNAAMAEALRCLAPSVDRTDEVGRTAPPPPPMSPPPLPRGSRARAKTKMVAAGNSEEDVPDLSLLGCQRTAAREAAVAPEAAQPIGEEQEHRCPHPRGGRARGKTRKAGARKTEKEVVSVPHTLPGNQTTVAEEAAAPVDVEEVAVGMRTRRSARSKVKIALDQKEEGVQAAVRKEQKADSSDAAIAPAVVSEKSCGDSKEHAAVIAVEEEVTKPQEGQNMMRRAAPCKTHDDLQQDQRAVEEVATATKRTRRSRKSKVAAAARKGQKGPEVDPKDGEVVPKVEAATKPQEGKVTRRATVYKAQEETGQVTAAPEANAAVEAEEVATTKRRRRRPARSKVRVAARKDQKGDSSDAVNGSTVSDDPKEGQVVEVTEEGPTKPNEEEQEQISNAGQFASLPKLEDSPILEVVSKPNAADASDKAAVADKEAIKEDCFTFTSEADLSNLFVPRFTFTLDRFAKLKDVPRDKEEKKGSECWWMLL